MIDPAMCRPGRLDKLLYVDLPNSEERAEITGKCLRGVPLGEDGGEREAVKDKILEAVRSTKCEGYSGADLAALIREAGVRALRDTLRALDPESFTSLPGSTSTSEPLRPHNNSPSPSVKVTLDHVLQALEKVSPSVSAQQRRKYEALRSKFAGLPVRGGRHSGNKNMGTAAGEGGDLGGNGDGDPMAA